MMNRKRSFYLWVGVLAMMLGTNLPAQDIAGDWQGRLKAGPGELRVVVAIFKSSDGKWNGTLRSIDQSPDWGVGIPIDSIDLQGANLKFAVGALRGAYEGKVSPDGASIEGTWSQGKPLPLEFLRATQETAWKDPAPHTVEFVTVESASVNAPVKLEVLDWGGSGRPLALLAGLGNTAQRI